MKLQRLPVGRLRHLALSFLLLFAALLGHAADDSPSFEFNLERGRLASSLQQFAQQAGIQIIFFSSIAEDLNAPALNGRYTVRDGLQRLLEGSSLSFWMIDARSVAIEARNPPHDRQSASSARRARSASRTESQSAPLEEVVVTGTAEELVATRVKTPLLEVPQSLSIIPQSQIQLRNETELADALEDSPAITMVRVDSLDSAILARGFRVTTLHFDRGAALSAFNQLPYFGTPDLGEFDHVEVLRGSDALFGGMGDPGATVSLVRKRPLRETALRTTMWAGSWNSYRAEVDVTGPVALDGDLRGRVDAVLSDRDYFYAIAKQKKRKIFGALEYDLTPSTLITLGGSFESITGRVLFGGLPLYRDGSDPHLPRDTALGVNWSNVAARSREGYAQLKQEFGPAWNLNVSATWLARAVDYRVAQFNSPIEKADDSIADQPEALMSTSPNATQQLALDATMTGTFDVLGHRVELAFGADFTRLKGKMDSLLILSFGQPVGNAFAFDPAAYPSVPTGPGFLVENQSNSSQRGEFVSTRVHVTDPWSILAGARVNGDRRTSKLSTSYGGFSSPPYESLAESNGKVTPFLAALYDIHRQYSVYASYADVYQSNNGVRQVGGDFLPPEDGVDAEVGVKGSWRGGRLNGLLVAYYINQRGISVLDDNSSNEQRLEFPNCCYRRGGSNRSKGLEMELTGQLADGWLLNAAYSYNVNHDFTGSYVSTQTPRHLLKLWSLKQLPGRWHSLSVGGGMHAQSATYAEGLVCSTPVTGAVCTGTEEPGRGIQSFFAVFDAQAMYDLDPHWRISMSIKNVFDRHYYQTIGTPNGGSWYGDPRAFLARVEGRY